MSDKKTTKKKSVSKSSTKKDDKEKKINDTIDNIRTRFGEDSILTLDPSKRIEHPKISTGSIGLDYALGIGGLPRGRVIEVFGPESSGKTTLALHTVAEAQKGGGVCAFIDAEHAIDPIYAKKIGVNVKDLLISQPKSGEEALEIVDSLIRTQKIDCIVIDSVAALTPKREIEGDIDTSKYIGTQARLMSLALRKLTPSVAKSNTVVIFINQIRMQINNMFGNPETTPGGKALKFYSSVRLDIRRIKQIKKGEDVVGGRVRVKVVKNKVSAPHQSTEFDLLYDEGISREGEILALGEKYGIISKVGLGSYTYGKEKLGRGYDASRKTLIEKKDLTKNILKDIIEELEKKRDL